MLSQGVGATLEAYGGTVAEARAAAKGGAVTLSRWTNRLRAAVRATDGHEQLMSVLRRAAYTRDGALLFVNAGVDPSRPLSQQADSFWWGSRGFEAIDEPYDGFVRVVRGADAQRRGVVINDRIASIDGGCGFGGPLVAACFDGTGSLLDLIET
jgi:serine/threonine protein phosphatase 1